MPLLLLLLLSLLLHQMSHTTHPLPVLAWPGLPCPAVHDFGFMRFDPAKLQFMQAGEIPLAPHAAAVGLDIQVVGNDSGEKARVAGHVLNMQQRSEPASAV